MLGIVLAAGQGKRLRPLTDSIPKTLLTVDGDKTLLSSVLENLASVGIADIGVVTGHAAGAIEAVAGELETALGVSLTLIANDMPHWNNAYSLWLARDRLAAGALVVNGDTLHPAEVERRMLQARGPGVLIALDDQKVLGDEEMKVVLNGDGHLSRINKALDPTGANGEYIGLTLVEPEAGPALADALKATFERDRDLYYEDGFQEYADRGGRIATVSVGGLEWCEVDDHADLARAREIACRS